MPELPEVETIVRGLRPHAVSRSILAIDAARCVCRTPPARLAQLTGRPIRAIERIGKYIRIVCPARRARGGRGQKPAGDDRELVLTVHLGMAGRMVAVAADTPPAKHTYLRVALDGASRVELRLVNPRWCMGGVWVGAAGAADDPTSKLGVDPLAVEQEQFIALLDRRRQIKALLLDQTLLAGVGNIYADESLFQAGIHPRAVAGRLSVARRVRLLAAIRDRLNDAIAKGGSSIRDYRDADGKEGLFQLTLKVYGRTGEPCTACGGRVVRNITAGRSTHFCPRCQRQPSRL